MMKKIINEHKFLETTASRKPAQVNMAILFLLLRCSFFKNMFEIKTEIYLEKSTIGIATSPAIK